MKRPDPDQYRLTRERTLEVTPRDGAVWIDCRAPGGAVLIALSYDQAMTIAASIGRAAAAALGQERGSRA